MEKKATKRLGQKKAATKYVIVKINLMYGTVTEEGAGSDDYIVARGAVLDLIGEAHSGPALTFGFMERADFDALQDA